MNKTENVENFIGFGALVLIKDPGRLEVIFAFVLAQVGVVRDMV